MVAEDMAEGCAENMLIGLNPGGMAMGAEEALDEPALSSFMGEEEDSTFILGASLAKEDRSWGVLTGDEDSCWPW